MKTKFIDGPVWFIIAGTINFYLSIDYFFKPEIITGIAFILLSSTCFAAGYLFWLVREYKPHHDAFYERIYDEISKQLEEDDIENIEELLQGQNPVSLDDMEIKTKKK